MRASQLHVPDMELKELIPFLKGILYAEEFYGIATAQQLEVQYEEMTAKEEEE